MIVERVRRKLCLSYILLECVNTRYAFSTLYRYLLSILNSFDLGRKRETQ